MKNAATVAAISAANAIWGNSLEQPPLPVAAVGLPQPRVEARLETDPGADDLRRLTRADEVGGPQRPDPLRHDAVGELGRLPAAGVVERRVPPALEAERL